MKAYGVVTFEADSANGVDNMINSFITREKVEVINVSLSTTYDQGNEQIVFAVSIAYSYEA